MDATARVTFEQVGGRYMITAVHLDLKAAIPGADNTKLEKLATISGNRRTRIRGR